MFLSAQLALAVQQQQQHQRNIPPNPFLTAYASLLGNPSLVPSMMSERLKASRFNPYNKPNFNNSTSNSSSHVTISKNISESENSLSCQTQVRMKKKRQYFVIFFWLGWIQSKSICFNNTKVSERIFVSFQICFGWNYGWG